MESSQFRTELGSLFYKATKDFLDKYHDFLTAEERGHVLNEYILAWKKGEFLMPMENTEYFAIDRESTFGKIKTAYKPHTPMIAGFNLRGALLTGRHSSLTFLHVDCKDANFSNVEISFSHFENCSMNNLIINAGTHLQECRFEKCQVNSTDFQKAGLFAAQFSYCSLVGSQLPKNTYTFQCKKEADREAVLEMS